MKSSFLALFIVVCPLAVFAQTSTHKAQLPPHPNAPASQEVETEKIVAPGQTAAVPSARTSTTGFMEPAQVKALMHKIWLAQYRLSDLLTQVHAEKWKMPPGTRQSFEQSLDSLHKVLAAEEDWRSQYDGRPDSLYLGFQTYLAISAVLPRVDGVARSVSQYANASFGAQYSQAANQLYDLQQMMQPHLLFLLKNQDDFLLVAQTNLASCQNELNFAEHNKEGKATPMKNIAPVFKGHGRTAATNKTGPKGGATSKPGATQSSTAKKK
jgi:hypothetical protein